MRYTCTVCNRELVTRHDELSWSELASGARPVPYHACIHEPNEAPAYACADCIDEHDSPGKFEGFHNRGELGRALILYAWVGVSGEDDSMSNEGWGYCVRLGRFLLMEDDRGFVSVEEHKNEVEAATEFDDYYCQGWGADESDAYISDDRNGYAVSFAGKYIGTFERLTRAKACISLEMRKAGFYPSVWHCSERGNIANVEVW